MFTNNTDLPNGGLNGGNTVQHHTTNHDIFPKGASSSVSPHNPPNTLSKYIPEALSNPYGDVPKFSTHGPQHKCAWSIGDTVDVDVFVSEDGEHNITEANVYERTQMGGEGGRGGRQPYLMRWGVSGWHFGGPEEGPVKEYRDEVPCGSKLQNNGTIYAHVYLTLHGSKPEDGRGGGKSYYTRVQMNSWRIRRKDKEGRNLLEDFGGEGEEGGGEDLVKEVRDSEERRIAGAKRR